MLIHKLYQLCQTTNYVHKCLYIYVYAQALYNYIYTQHMLIHICCLEIWVSTIL